MVMAVMNCEDHGCSTAKLVDLLFSRPPSQVASKKYTHSMPTEFFGPNRPPPELLRGRGTEGVLVSNK